MSDDTCLYLYGVIPSSSDACSGLAGIEEHSELSLVRCGDLACAVSLVPSSAYRNQPDDAAAQLAWITPRAVRHHEIVQQLSARSTVVPLKFGTLCATRDGVVRLLQELHAPLVRLLSYFESRHEWVITARADRSKLLRLVEQDEPELAAMERQAQRLPEGQAYFLRKKRQRLAQELLEVRVASLAEEVRSRLALCLVQCAAAESQCTAADEQVLVLHETLLVEVQGFAALEKALEEIEADYSHYALAVELSGPWPPYSFCRDLFANEAAA